MCSVALICLKLLVADISDLARALILHVQPLLALGLCHGQTAAVCCNDNVLAYLLKWPVAMDITTASQSVFSRAGCCRAELSRVW